MEEAGLDHLVEPIGNPLASPPRYRLKLNKEQFCLLMQMFDEKVRGSDLDCLRAARLANVN
jgi:hypothetical protein